MNAETSPPTVTEGLLDSVVRDLIEAIDLLHNCRQQSATFPATTVWAILTAAKGHLERQLRNYLTGDGLGERNWNERRV